MISVALFEDDYVAYDILVKNKDRVPTFKEIHWQLSRTIVKSVKPSDLKHTGWVAGNGRDLDTFATFEETHDLLASSSMPDALIMVLDMEVITSETLIGKYIEIHKLDDIDVHLVGGISLAIQAINNPKIRTLQIYPATGLGDNKEIETYLRRRVAKIDTIGRKIDIQPNVGKFIDQARKILEINEQFEEEVRLNPLDEFLGEMSKRSVDDNHKLFSPQAPAQMALLFKLMGINWEVAKVLFKIVPGDETALKNHLVFESLKQFGSGGSPSLSLFNVLCIALSVLIREHNKDVLKDPEFEMLRIWIGKNHYIEDSNQPLKEFARDMSILPMQSFETYKDSARKLSTLFTTLFWNDKGAENRCNLVGISVSFKEITFYLRFPSKKLIGNLNRALQPKDSYRLGEQGRNSTTAILRFLARMLYSDALTDGKMLPETRQFGNGANMIVKGNNEQFTELTFYVH